MRTKGLVLVVLAAASQLCLAQTGTPGQAGQGPKDSERSVAGVDSTQQANPAFYFQRPQIELPQGPNAWAIELDRTGGYAPTHRSITLTSGGRVTIDDSTGACSYEMPGGFPELGRLIAEANESGWGQDTLQPAPTSMCADCRLWRLTLYGRTPAGITYGHSAYWDDASFSKLKKEVAAICSAVEKIKHECSQPR